jgi:hypothetical protein
MSGAGFLEFMHPAANLPAIPAQFLSPRPENVRFSGVVALAIVYGL